jgi:tetratricopeptide (TPR) repeat protein
MNRFCPHCDATVATAADHRCPHCHRMLESTPEPATATGGMPRNVRLVALLVVGALVVTSVAGGLWMFVGTPPRDRTRARAEDAPQTLGDKFAAAGLRGDKAIAPGTPDTALETAARQAKDTDGAIAALQALVGPGKLAAQAPLLRRRHPILSTAALLADVQAGKARPVHSVEAAFIAAAWLEARGLQPEFVVDATGPKTPLLLSRLQVAVHTDGKILDLLGDPKLKQVRPVAREQVVAWWLILRGHLARLDSDAAAARRDFAAARLVHPDDAAVAFAEGVTDIDQGMIDRGLAKCDVALARLDDPFAHLYLVEVMVAHGKAVPALQRADGVLKRHPGLPEALVAKGVLLAQRVPTLPDAQKSATAQEARKLLDDALAKDAQTPGARAAIGQLLYMQKQETAGEQWLRAAVEQFRDPDCALLLADVLRQGGRAAEAVAVLEKVDRALDDDRFLMGLLASYTAARQTDKALQLADKAHELSPHNLQVALLRADLLRQAGKIDAAIAALEPAKVAGDDGDRITLLQAQLLIQAGKTKEAVAQVEAVAARRPQDREARLLQVAALAMAGRGDDGTKLGAQLMADRVLKPLEVAGVFLQMGDADRAGKLLEAALPQGGEPADAEVAAMLAMVYTASGRKSDAVTLRDKLTAQAGEKGKDLREAIDRSIDAAEHELARMKAEQQAAPPTPTAAP